MAYNYLFNNLHYHMEYNKITNGVLVDNLIHSNPSVLY